MTLHRVETRLDFEQAVKMLQISFPPFIRVLPSGEIENAAIEANIRVPRDPFPVGRFDGLHEGGERRRRRRGSVVL